MPVQIASRSFFQDNRNRKVRDVSLKINYRKLVKKVLSIVDPFHQIVFHKISCLQKDENVIISLRYVFKNASIKFYNISYDIF